MNLNSISMLHSLAATSKKPKSTNPITTLLLLAVLLLPTLTVAQEKTSLPDKNSQHVYVKFDYVKATKTYPQGNQITYVHVTGLPGDQRIVDKMQRHLLANMRINRVHIYSDQDRFMIDADADVNPEHVVDEMNIFLQKYYASLERRKLRENK